MAETKKEDEVLEAKEEIVVTEIAKADAAEKPAAATEAIQNNVEGKPETVKKRPGRKSKAQKEAEAAAAAAADVAKAEEAPVKKTRGRKPAAGKEAAEKKTAGRKAAEKKTTIRKTATKAAAEKKSDTQVRQTVTLQFAGKSYSTEDLMKMVKDVWVYDLGGKEKNLRTVELYVKPEENKVYYVINAETVGDFSI